MTKDLYLAILLIITISLGFICIIRISTFVSAVDIISDFNLNPDKYIVKDYYKIYNKGYYVCLYDKFSNVTYHCPITERSYDFLKENNGFIRKVYKQIICQ